MQEFSLVSMAAGALVLLVSWLWYRRTYKWRGLPPCPLPTLPIVGNLLWIDPDPRRQFEEFRERCGDIFRLQLGSTRLVVLNGLEVIRDALVTHGDDFSDRAVIFVDIASDGINKGIGSSNGDIWKEHRKFASSVLRKFGLGKNVLAEKIQEEVDCFLAHLGQLQGQPRDISSITAVSVCNIMCSLMMGRRYEYDDAEFKRLIEIFRFNLSKVKGTALLNFFPWLRFLPGDLFYCKIITKNFKEFFDIFARVHLKDNENVFGEPGNFIAAYLQEMKMKESRGQATYLDRPNLLRLILDFFSAGMETSATTLSWIFLYLIHFPEVQENIFQEISRVVGCERSPTMHDKVHMPLLSSVLMEVQRLTCVLPFSMTRVLARDVHFRGYFLPAGTELLVNFDSVMKDPKSWGQDTRLFRPERFLDQDGGLLSPEAWVPFSMGRRSCLGESMANSELFLYTAGIIQKFKLVPADLNLLPPLEGRFALTVVTQPYEIRCVSR